MTQTEQAMQRRATRTWDGTDDGVNVTQVRAEEKSSNRPFMKGLCGRCLRRKILPTSFTAAPGDCQTKKPGGLPAGSEGWLPRKQQGLSTAPCALQPFSKSSRLTGNCHASLIGDLTGVLPDRGCHALATYCYFDSIFSCRCRKKINRPLDVCSFRALVKQVFVVLTSLCVRFVVEIQLGAGPVSHIGQLRLIMGVGNRIGRLRAP